MTTNVFSTFISLTDVRSFYSTALAYVFDKLPLQKEELEMAEVMDVKKKDFSKVHPDSLLANQVSMSESGFGHWKTGKRFFKVPGKHREL